MKQFIKKVFAMIIILAVIVASVNYIYVRNAVNYGTMGELKNDAAYPIDVPENIQICNFGNSHGYYGFDYVDYVSDLTCYNFSLPSQSVSYDYRILENYKDNIAPGAVVFICISPQSFFGKGETESTTFTSKNKRYYHFLDKQYIKNYDFKTDIFVNYLPSLSTSTTNLIKTLLNINPNIDMWNFETDPEAALKHGSKHYIPPVDDGKLILNDEELNAAYQMVELCREIGAVPIFITTPYLLEFTTPISEKYGPFFDEFFAVINQLCADTDAEYYCYAFDERFTRSYQYFFNTDHLNKDGAEAFTKILMDEVVYANQSHLARDHGIEQSYEEKFAGLRGRLFLKNLYS